LTFGARTYVITGRDENTSTSCDPHRQGHHFGGRVRGKSGDDVPGSSHVNDTFVLVTTSTGSPPTVERRILSRFGMKGDRKPLGETPTTHVVDTFKTGRRTGDSAFSLKDHPEGNERGCSKDGQDSLRISS